MATKHQAHLIFKLLLVCLLAIMGNNVYSQNDCGNVGFEFGNNTGWTGYAGDCSSGPTFPVNSLPTLNFTNTPTPWTTPQYFLDGVDEFPPKNRWQIVGPNDGVNGFDSIISSIPVVSPWGGTKSLKLGNSSGNHRAERLKYAYTVDANNFNFVYQYAVILQSPGHETYEMPAFRVKFTNSANQLINPTCGQYNVYGGIQNQGFNTVYIDFDSVSYRNWSLVSIDLSAYIGQTINIEFSTNDCIFSVHYGYAYIDMSCIPLELVTSYCSGSPTADVTAPDGYVSYSWTANAPVNYPPPAGPTVPIGNIITNNQTLIVPSIDTVTWYTVDIIPYQGALCAAHLNYQFNPTPTLTALFSAQAYCGNTASLFQDSSIIANNGAPPSSWIWDFGDGGTSSIQNPSHNYPVLPYDTTYAVSLVVFAGASCKDTIIDSVFVPSGLNIDTTIMKNVSCAGADDGKAVFNVNGSPGAIFTYNWVLPNSPGNTQGAFGIKPNAATTPNIPLYWFKAYDYGNGCFDSVSFTITEPPPLLATIATEYINCQGTTDTLQAIVFGGTSPYQYQWFDPNGQTTSQATGLLAGNYTVNIKDANDCTTTTTGQLIDGSQLNYRIHTTNVSCHGLNDGTVAIQLFDGKPSYALTWHIDADTLAIASDTSFINALKRTNSYVVIKNKNGCENDTITFSILEPDTINAQITTTNTTCEVAKNGAIKVDVIGGVAPYTYLWSTDHDKTKQGVKDLYFGSDTVTIIDANNCVYVAVGYIDHDSNFVVTTNPDFVYDAQAGNSLTATIDKPGNYTYLWSNGDMMDDSTIAAPQLNQLFFPEQFRVDVVDEFGCANFDSVDVDVVPLAYFPTAFSPNGDKLNDTLSISISSKRISNFNLDIFDRWGGRVFNATQPNFKWDGKKDGQEMLIGVYNYRITYIDNRKKPQKLTGTISLMR